ncbi:MAG: hypothetical protein F6K28_39915 [Microcoleus sp. SIO2G3]|nr:hypothetical protein [Microcoleus sp. SIO2G3]
MKKQVSRSSLLNYSDDRSLIVLKDGTQTGNVCRLSSVAIESLRDNQIPAIAVQLP